MGIVLSSLWLVLLVGLSKVIQFINYLSIELFDTINLHSFVTETCLNYFFELVGTLLTLFEVCNPNQFI